jgi:putative ABC transport system permease protein
MTFLALAFKNILRYRIRSLLTIAGIAASIAVLFSIISFNRGFERGLENELRKTGIHFMVVPAGCPHEVAALVLHGAVTPQFLDLNIIENIKDNKNISIASPILVSQLPNPEKHRIDLIYGMEMSHIKEIKPSWEIEGSIPLADNEVIVGYEVARHDNINIGDILNYPSAGKSFTVAGIIKRTGGQDDAFIYMPIKAVQEIVNKPGGATAIGVKVSDATLISKTVDELSRNIQGIQIVTMGQVMNTISTLASSAKVLSLSVAVVAILISAMSVMNSILMAIFERTQEIGMMRAIGASRFDTFRIIIKETIILTTAGGIAGLIIANIGSAAIEGFVKNFIPYVPSGKLITFEPSLAAACIMFSVVLGILAGIYPAWRASKITPIEAIKG